MKHIKGNILTVKNGYIFHICDSENVNNTEFDLALYKKFPLSHPQTKSTSGTVFISGEENGPDVVNMFCSSVFEKRQKDFLQCLEGMSDYFEFTSEKVFVHVPYKLGSNFSLSEWEIYVKFLLDFEEKMRKNNVDIELTVYH